MSSHITPAYQNEISGAERSSNEQTHTFGALKRNLEEESVRCGEDERYHSHFI
jgi:hypothetical protein